MYSPRNRPVSIHSHSRSQSQTDKQHTQREWCRSINNPPSHSPDGWAERSRQSLSSRRSGNTQSIENSRQSPKGQTTEAVGGGGSSDGGERREGEENGEEKRRSASGNNRKRRCQGSELGRWLAEFLVKGGRGAKGTSRTRRVKTQPSRGERERERERRLREADRVRLAAARGANLARAEAAERFSPGTRWRRWTRCPVGVAVRRSLQSPSCDADYYVFFLYRDL